MSDYKTRLFVIIFGLIFSLGMIFSPAARVKVLAKSVYGQSNYGNNLYVGNGTTTTTLPGITTTRTSLNQYLFGFGILILIIALLWLLWLLWHRFNRRKVLAR